MEWHHANRPLRHTNPPHTHDASSHTRESSSNTHTRTLPSHSRIVLIHTRILLTHTNPPHTRKSSTTVACFDLLTPEICEIVGGSLRENRLSQLLRSMRRHGLLKPGCLQDVAQVKEMGSSPVIQYGT